MNVGIVENCGISGRQWLQMALDERKIHRESNVRQVSSKMRISGDTSAK